MIGTFDERQVTGEKPRRRPKHGATRIIGRRKHVRDRLKYWVITIYDARVDRWVIGQYAYATRWRARAVVKMTRAAGDPVNILLGYIERREV